MNQPLTMDSHAEPTQITRRLLRDWPLPQDGLDGGKEARGRVFVVGGSEEIPGGVILAAEAALRAGAGKLLVATSQSVAPHVAIALPEARVIGLQQSSTGELAPASCERVEDDAARSNAIVVGPGMLDGAAGVELVAACLRLPDPPALVIDAAPLVELQALRDTLRAQRPHTARLVLTPHAGEMARLCGRTREQVCAAPLATAREVAAELGAVVVLKNARTYVVAPDGSAFLNTAGNPGLGTSGSGDVLAGLIAGFCARAADPLQAAVYGTHLHALAGDRLARKLGPLGYLARELAREVPSLLGALARPAQSLSGERAT